MRARVPAGVAARFVAAKQHASGAGDWRYFARTGHAGELAASA